MYTVFDTTVHCSARQAVDRADGGGAPSLRDAAAGRPGGDRPRQKAEGGQGHPLPGSGWVILAIHRKARLCFFLCLDISER